MKLDNFDPSILHLTKFGGKCKPNSLSSMREVYGLAFVANNRLFYKNSFFSDVKVVNSDVCGYKDTVVLRGCSFLIANHKSENVG
jgi:hypothetical protein